MKNRNKLGILGIIILQIMVLNINIIESEASNINFKNIKTEDGLSQSTVETIYQDSKGYIWIGTNDGLNKYNGYEFEVYKHNHKLENSISNNYIVDIQEDENGNMWIGTAHGLSKINSQTNEITNYFAEKNKGNLSNNNIGDILIGKNNEVIVGTSKGLNIYNEEDDEFERIFSADNELTNQNIRTLIQDKNDEIWITTEIGLNKVNLESKKVERFYSTNDENSLSNNNLYGLYADDDYIWAGTYNSGLNRINTKTGEIKRYIHDKNDKTSIPGNYIRDILKDKNRTIWIATDNGLAKFNEEDETFTTYSSSIYDRNGLIGDEVFTVMQDNSGLIWVGTYSGISIFDPNNNIIHYKKNPLENNGLIDNAIHGIYQDKDNIVWVGTNSSGLNLINLETNTVSYVNYKNTNGKFSDDGISDIIGNENTIYIGTDNGLNIIDKDKEKIEVYNKESGLAEDKITSLFLDSKGYLWIGHTGTVTILNTQTKEIIDLKYSLRKNEIEKIYVKEIYEDKNGIYWLGCFINHGLVKIDPYKNIIKSYKNIKSDETSISSNTVRYITEDLNGELWIGTSYGLNKFDREKEIFKSYTESDNLSNNIVYGILTDKDNNLWISTNNGISKFNTNTNKFENFGITDGLQGIEFNGNASYKNEEGLFFFGGVNGINIFYPSELKRNQYTPRVEFDKFKVNGKTYNNIDGYEFDHNENLINISIFLPDYTNTRNVKYSYKLEGADEIWSTLESNDINYSNLPPGEYTLKVKAKSYNGLESPQNQVSFTIKPPFYKSKIAFMIYLFIILMIVYLMINRMKYLDKLVDMKTKELSDEMKKSNSLLNKVIELEQRKNNYFINLSHELRTPLNVIYTTEQLITEFNKSEKGIEKEKLSEYMLVMRRNTKRLLRLINNLIDTSKIEQGKYKIDLKECDIVYIVEAATLSLKEYVESKGIELIIDPEIEEKLIMCDEYEIERCIVNLVGNAAKFTPSGGKIEVGIQELGDKVKITVQDTGVGIDPKHHNAIFDRFNQIVDVQSEVKGGSGLGLTITKQIIDLHDGRIYVESELGEGCKFNIVL